MGPKFGQPDGAHVLGFATFGLARYLLGEPKLSAAAGDIFNYNAHGMHLLAEGPCASGKDGILKYVGLVLERIKVTAPPSRRCIFEPLSREQTYVGLLEQLKERQVGNVNYGVLLAPEVRLFL